jgi:hypothetical protein
MESKFLTSKDTALRFANVFPLMKGEEFKTFVADVKSTNGPRERITLYQGEILEGRNRYRACLRLKLKPEFETFEGDNAAARAFVMSRNVHRRHLTTKEKAIEALIKAMPEKSDREIGRMTKSVAVNTKFKKLDIDLSDGTVLSCNPSNVTRLIRAWGAESETRVGREIELSIGEVDYQGQPTETIVATPVGPPLENKAPVKKPPKRGNAGGDLDDEIPSEGDESLSGRKALSSPSL